MGKLAPDETPTEEIEVAFTLDHIETELGRWGECLKAAKATGDPLAIDAAQRWADTWLDRRLALRGR